MVWGGQDTAMRPIILLIIQFAWSREEPLNGEIVDSILRTIFLKGSGDDEDMRSLP